MNAVIQCLAGTERMMEIISDKTVMAPEGSVYNELKLLITGITSGVYERIIPLKFKKKIDEYLGEYRGYGQHDAHDFMCHLLERIDKEVNLEKDQFLKIFTGATEVKRKCTGCLEGETVAQKDFFTSLHIEFKDEKDDEVDVGAAIKALFTSEEFECQCEKCGGNKSIKETSIKELPEVLTLQIKRFAYEKEHRWLTKNHTMVHYPKRLEIDKDSYELYAYINHSGVLAGGHYVAVSKQEVTNKWFCYNDDKTQEVEVKDTEKSRLIYILFYKKVSAVDQEKQDVALKELIQQKEGKEEEEVLICQDKDKADLVPKNQQNEEIGLDDEEERPKRSRQPSQKIRDMEEPRESETLSVIDVPIEDMERSTEDQGNEIPNPQKPTQDKCNKCLEVWSGFQIACDDCGEWFHGKCVGVKEGEYGKNDEYRCTTCWAVNAEKAKETQEQQGNLIAQLEGRADKLEKEKEKTTSKCDRKEKENTKQAEKMSKQEDELIRKKNEINRLKEEKEKIKQTNQDKERRLKEQEAQIAKMTREKADNDKKQEKLNSKIKQLEEEKQSTESCHEKEKLKLIKEIENRETEVVILNRYNQELKRTNRAVEMEKAILSQDEIPIRLEEKSSTIKNDAGTQCSNNGTLSESNLAQKENEGTADGLELLQLEHAKLKKDLAEKVNTITKKNKEIESLKERICEYVNRLENTLADNSTKEREVHHLTDGLDTLKRINAELVLELDRKGTEMTRKKGKTECDPTFDNKKMENRSSPGIEKHDAEDLSSEDPESKDEPICAATEQQKEKNLEVNNDPEDKMQNETKGEEVNKNKDGGEVAKDVRKDIKCNFGVRCKFWKIDVCRYNHPKKFEETGVDKEDSKDNGNSKKMRRMCWYGKECEKDDCNFEHKCSDAQCKMERNCKYLHVVNSKENNANTLDGNKTGSMLCQKGKRCDNKHCVFGHECRKADCTMGEKCKYIHNRGAVKAPKEGGKDKRKDSMKTDATKDEASQQKEKKEVLCRFYRNCKYKENCPYYHPQVMRKSKNGGEEMQTLHFLTKEILNLKASNLNLRKEMNQMKGQRMERTQDGENQGKTH